MNIDTTITTEFHDERLCPTGNGCQCGCPTCIAQHCGQVGGRGPAGLADLAALERRIERLELVLRGLGVNLGAP